MKWRASAPAYSSSSGAVRSSQRWKTGPYLPDGDGIDVCRTLTEADPALGCCWSPPTPTTNRPAPIVDGVQVVGLDLSPFGDQAGRYRLSSIARAYDGTGASRHPTAWTS